MKKILTIAVSALLALALNAQEHFKFKEIPINGNVEEMVTALADKGYTLEQYLNGEFPYMRGKFAGEDATIIVVPTAKTKTVWKVRVVFKSSDNWYEVKGEYNKLKEALADKYGKPESYEFFSKPYKEGDGYEVTAFYAGKGSWDSFYDVATENGKVGSVWLTIQKVGTKIAVFIDYEDEFNRLLSRAEEKNQMHEDL